MQKQMHKLVENMDLLHESVLLRNASIIDLESGQYQEADISIRGGKIAETATKLSTGNHEIIKDLKGAFVIPGLIDCHVHVTACSANLAELRTFSPSYLAVAASQNMNKMLHRGFTTIRDMGGADFGLERAQKEGLLQGPRLIFGGRAISQTGGHGDDRSQGVDNQDNHAICGSWSQIADGVDEVRLAVRNELRRGAHHIKIMASGGVASPSDRVDSTGYSREELQAIVEEAEAANRYVAAHAYTARAVNRALSAGVRSIEHGNLIDQSSIELFKTHEAFLVMNLVTYWALDRDGKDLGLPDVAQKKIADVLDGGYTAFELAARSGIKLVYGTDLLGGMQKYQSNEFEIRANFQSAIEILRSATTIAASLINMEGQVGCISPGAFADLITLNEDPLEDITILCHPERFSNIIAQGVFVSSGSSR
jgi:imidazolonepropionase-like amidohydrolase